MKKETEKKSIKYIGNIFVVSRLGQLRNVQNFIKQYNAEDNILFIQYSGNESPILKNMLEICERDLYTDIIYIKLPNRPLSVTKKKNIKMYNLIYEKLLYCKENHNFNNLFMCNADKWYSYYEKIKNELKLNITVNLLEEGLTTYLVSANPKYSENEIKPITINDIKKNIIDIKKISIKSLKNIKNLILKFVILILKILSFIFRVNITENLKKYILDTTLMEKYKFSYVTHFDKAYVCFPEKLKPTNFKIDKIEKLDFKFNEINKEQLRNLNKDYTLFINQKYIDYEKHFDIIFKIFTEIGINNIYIKLHPKENKEEVSNIIEKCLKEKSNLKIEIINNLDSIPVEDLVYNCGFKNVVGLTSSSLLYCNEFLKDVKITSIATRYRELCNLKENKVNLKELELFDKEYQSFLENEDIMQYNKVKDK